MRVPRGRPATVLLVLSLLLVLGLVVEGEMGHSGVVPGLGGVTWSDLFQDTYQEAYESYEAGILTTIRWKEPDGRLTDRVIPLGMTGKRFARSLCVEYGYNVSSSECRQVMDTLHQSSMYLPHLSSLHVEDLITYRVTMLELIRRLFPTHTRYLEIGCAGDEAFHRMQHVYPTAYCVDPEKGGNARMTSDQWFEENTQVFDVIFVDGLHQEDQVLIDVHNALKWLSPNGVVVMHDCVPRSKRAGLREDTRGPDLGPWNGDVWRAALRLRAMTGMDMIVVDIDEGVGLLRKLPNRQPLLPPSRYLGKGSGEWPVLDYEVDFMDQEPSLMRMHNVRDAVSWLVSTSEAIAPWLQHASLSLQASASLGPLQNHTQSSAAPAQPPQALLTLALASTLALPASLHPPSLPYTQQCYAMANDVITCRDITHHLLTPVFLSRPSVGVLGELSLGAEVVASGAVRLAVWQEQEEVVLSTWLWDQAGNTTCCTTGIKVPITHPHTHTAAPLFAHLAEGSVQARGAEAAIAGLDSYRAI